MGGPWDKYQAAQSAGGPWAKYGAPQEPAAQQQPGFIEGLARSIGKGLSFGGSETERAYGKLGVPPAIDADTMTPSEMSKAAEAYGNVTPEKLAAQKAQGTQEMDAYRNQHPVAAIGGEVAGSVANPIGLLMGGGVAQGARAAGEAIPALANGAGRYASFAGQGAATGAGYGALSNPEHPGKGAALGAATGAALGVVVPALTEGGAKIVGKVANAFKSEAPSMSQDQFKTAAQSAYKAVDDAGVIIDQAPFQKFVSELPADLSGFHPRVTPGANDIIEALKEEAAKGPVTLTTLDKLRSIAGEATATTNRNEARLAGNIAGKIDDFIDGLKPGDLLGGGDSEGAVDSLKSARSLWKTYSKIKAVSDIVDTGENLNDMNWVKGRFKAIVKKPSAFNRYTPDEQSAISDIARTGSLEKIGKLIPWRGLQMTTQYAEPIAQDAKISALQNLIARGGTRPPSPSLTPALGRFMAGAPAPLSAQLVSSMMGGSNQRP